MEEYKKRCIGITAAITAAALSAGLYINSYENNQNSSQATRVSVEDKALECYIGQGENVILGKYVKLEEGSFFNYPKLYFQRDGRDHVLNIEDSVVYGLIKENEGYIKRFGNVFELQVEKNDDIVERCSVSFGGNLEHKLKEQEK